MAIPSVGGGYQFTDGNVNERTIGVQTDPQTATVTATLTAAQITGGLLVATPTAATASYTLPVAADIDAVLGNAKVNSTFMLSIINLQSSVGVITIVTNTGLTTVGTLTIGLTGAASTAPPGVAQFLFRKTGVAAYSVYRVS
tara:strand:+ start:631 stop:1056 length:426 start_codon:yes stop_codon:yes gene_type:complete